MVEVNTVAAVVVQWSDASFIEDQDQWWLGGLHREVYLYSTAPVYIADVFAKGELGNDYRDGHFKLTVDVGFSSKAEEGWSVEAQLLDPANQCVFEEPLLETVPVGKPISWPRMKACFEATLADVLPWSAERPHLYTLVVTLKDPKGAAVDYTSTRVGFPIYRSA